MGIKINIYECLTLSCLLFFVSSELVRKSFLSMWFPGLASR